MIAGIIVVAICASFLALTLWLLACAMRDTAAPPPHCEPGEEEPPDDA